MPKFEVVRSQVAHGGQIVTVGFSSEPTAREIDEAVRAIDDCPFGYRILGRVHSTVDHGEYVTPVFLVDVKIYSD